MFRKPPTTSSRIKRDVSRRQISLEKKPQAPPRRRFFNLFTKDMAMDLGTANTLIYVKGEGIVLNEPSVVAYHADTKEVLAVGREAKSYMGRTPRNIIAQRPLKDGVIADFEVTRHMIREFFLRVQRMGRFFKPTVVICVPAGITQVEKRAVVEAADEAGVGKVFLIEEPVAAAIGTGLDISENKGQMIIDIGGGTTEVAVLSLFSVAYSESVRVAGDEVNEAIMRYLLKKHQLLVGENTAEVCKIKAGSAFPVEGLPAGYLISGKDAIHNTPKDVTLSPEEIREAIAEPVAAVVEAVHRACEKTPPDLLTDIHADGIHMAGGGSLLKGLDALITHETQIRCQLAEDPLTTIVMGSGIALEDLDKYRRVFVN
ncbi:MAG: rod shape-determining protein [Thermodesulfobacteriota bacterium]